MSIKGVVRILRLPLVVTAMADSVAGYAVALLPHIERFDSGRAALLAGASAGLYLFGMVENDLADIRRDRLMKVPRPLVTGDLSVAWAVVLLVLAAALAAACSIILTGGALVVAIATFAAVNLYNLAAKRGPAYVAMTVMGLCRLLNFGMGVVATAGFPRHIEASLFFPTGPLWVRHGLALFFATAVITGYSICARAGDRVSSRPWQAAFVIAAAGGFAMIAASVLAPDEWLIAGRRLYAPVARVLAAVLLASMWPGGLWAVTGPQRQPEEYAPFIERAIYWMLALDAAFLLDGLLIR